MLVFFKNNFDIKASSGNKKKVKKMEVDFEPVKHLK